jgi:hypothetical protein
MVEKSIIIINLSASATLSNFLIEFNRQGAHTTNYVDRYEGS